MSSSARNHKITKSPWQTDVEKQLEQFHDDIHFLLEHQSQIYKFLSRLASNAARNAGDKVKELSHED